MISRPDLALSCKCTECPGRSLSPDGRDTYDPVAGVTCSHQTYNPCHVESGTGLQTQRSPERTAPAGANKISDRVLDSLDISLAHTSPLVLMDRQGHPSVRTSTRTLNKLSSAHLQSVNLIDMYKAEHSDGEEELLTVWTLRCVT